jgi:phosphotransferase system enzyme I (PtsI)
MVIDAGRANNKPVSMCGEMAGNPHFIPLLLGMGLRKFSMRPGSVLEAKRIIRGSNVDQLSTRVSDLMDRLDDENTIQLLCQLGDLAC